MRTHVLTLGSVVALGLTGCTSSAAPEGCSAEFAGGLCLDMSAADGLLAHQALIEEEVGRTLDRVLPLLDVTNLRIAVIDDPSRVIPETGFGGFNPNAEEVRLFADSNRPGLDAVIRSELLPTLAHEIHHAMRRRAIGYGSSLLQAAVSEGLADHFSIEMAPGYDPPWTRALTEEELSVWLPEVTSRSSGAYSHPEWFHGAGASIPRWTGYSVGFELVRLYLGTHPDQLASTLVGEPATSFVSPDFRASPDR